MRLSRKFLVVSIAFSAIFSFATNTQALECDFAQTLRFGSRGAAVVSLQKTLNSDLKTQVAQKGPGSPGSETTYFGLATDRAVRALQTMYADEILKPAGLTKTTGIVGEMTKKALRKLCLSKIEKKNPSPPATSTPTQNTSTLLPPTATQSFVPLPALFSIPIPGFGGGGGSLPLTISAPSSLSTAEGSALSVSSFVAVGGSGNYTYAWNFGDGYTASGGSPSHAYADNGSFTLTVTVTDSANHSVSASTIVTVTNAAPTPTITGTYTTTTGSSLAFGNSVTDAGTADTSSGFTYSWDFGNGSTSVAQSPNFTYYVPGTYTVTLTVTDKDGTSASTNTTATISGDALIIPGSGWGGATSQPSNQGNSGDFGYTDNTIAQWDVVPYQTFSDTFRIGLLAFHNSGIDHVSFGVNGGAWTDISSMSLNPRTGVIEYWVTARAADFSDGQIEIRAVAYPETGVPLVLPSLYLNANSGSTLPNTIRYVSAASGNDLTGTGSIGNPFQTIPYAIASINSAQSGDVGGGVVYLQAGSYAYGQATENFTRNAATQWLTISAAPGVSSSSVIISSYGSTNGIRTRKVHVKDVTLNGVTSLPTNSTISAMGWLDSSTYIGPGQSVANSAPFASVANWTGGLYYTDVDISQSQNGAPQAKLVRHANVHDISSDAFQSTLLVVDSSARNIDPAATGFHPDVFQANGSITGNILYGVTATSGILAQGLFSDTSSMITDVAVVNSTFDNQYPTVSGSYVFALGATTTNLYIKDSSFTGPSIWRTDQHFNASAVVIENTYFSSSPGALTGVTFR